MKNNNYEFIETGGIYYWREKKEESFLKALINIFFFAIMVGGIMWVALKLVEIGVLPQ